MSIFKKNELCPYRLEGETYEEYCKRRKSVNIKVKMHLMGDIFWDSKQEGTYKRKLKPKT